MGNIHAYLTFDGNCREVMAYYQGLLGGELSLQTVGESPMADQWPAEAQDNILHARLTHGDLVLMASDGGQMASKVVEDAVPLPYVSLSLECGSEEDIQRLYAALSEGGKILCPLGEQFWGATFGALTDRYGVNWLLSHQKA